MIKKRYNPEKKESVFLVTNLRIRATEVRVLTDSGEVLGVMSRDEALAKARAAEKDLVLVAANAQPPVVKIIDAAKFKYQQKQKVAQQRKSAKTQETKEIRLKPFMGEGDIESRIKKVIGFLEKGDKVRLSVEFKGRAITKQDFGFNLVKRIITATESIGQVEVEPRMMGKKLLAQIMPKKKK